MRGTMIVLLVVAGILVDPVLARSQGVAGWAASVKDAGENSLDVGIDAYRDGALEVSVEALSDALENRLTNQQRAQALYFRGLAYRELGKPGQAILDLSGAISVKNGLSQALMNDAARNRDGAVAEAGLQPSETVIATGAVKNGPRTAVPIPSHRAPIADEKPHQRVPPPPALLSRAPPAPEPDDSIFSSLQELILNWP